MFQSEFVDLKRESATKNPLLLHGYLSGIRLRSRTQHFSFAEDHTLIISLLVNCMYIAVTWLSSLHGGLIGVHFWERIV
jgi:hypothetical protein